MTWKDILKRDFDIMPQEFRTLGRQSDFMTPPEKLMRYRTRKHPFESAQYVEKMIEKRYIQSADAEQLERLKRRLSEGDKRVKALMRRQEMSAAPARIAKNAFLKEFDSYIEYMENWRNAENLQAANKKWSELTHRVMLMVQTALNNSFPTIEDAYRSSDLNGFLFWKGDDYQELMKESLVDLEAPPTRKEKEAQKKIEMKRRRKEPPKRDYMAERKKRIEDMRRKR